MKKTLLILFGLLALMTMGTYESWRPRPYFLCTPGTQWEDAGDITTQLAALGVDARDTSAVWGDLSDATTIKYEVPNQANGVEIRFQTDADADSHVVNIYVCAHATMVDGTEDSFLLASTLTLTGGLQVGPNSNVFVDTITETAEVIWTDGTPIDSGNDRIALYRVDTRGYKYMVVIATTLQANTTLQMDVRWY